VSSGSPEFPPVAAADGWDPWPTFLLLALRAAALHWVYLAKLSRVFEFDFQEIFSRKWFKTC